MEPHHPDLFWYGVHGVEMLFTIMGTGCKEVVRAHSQGADVVTGKWGDGRLGTFRGVREGESDYGAILYREKGIQYLKRGEGSLYKNLLVRVIDFMKSGDPPVPQKETVEIFAFMTAADKSKETGGCSVPMEPGKK
jgi:hypothetical protein